MSANSLTLNLCDADHTARCAQLLAPLLGPGDVILLEGDVGAGKTHFARALIQSILLALEDVPSPTFTLVQSYETTVGPLWHADLYRLTSVYEVEELGLTEAFENAICLVEWPDRLGLLIPPQALRITLETGSGDDIRVLTARWSAPTWDQRLKVWRT
ncbi:tRNA (adenosine(37)-N6)-threonylcarbamoyltransferase complex ATPase subunit type 1 TsaE [Sulfitobacter aestuarii]|uniref:tRNA threonylcarbamoyladenosine biosynthesis protein TsaE n=1 Tax=Sulfitobacter aestuarii TaxID=2161676 RepID=A0ABW5U621_9RHOB